MIRMDDVTENVSIDAWARVFARSPGQRNAPHESDAELIELPGSPDTYLAITIDTVAEEIRSGLYRDPYTMGWVAAMASLSDLAAVGADAMGLVVSVAVPPACDDTFIGGVARGMEEACRTLGVFVLGGDSNATPEISLTGCAVGTVPRLKVMTRLGLEPGDAVYLTGRAGAGNALGLARLTGLPDELFPEERYRPEARIAAGLLLRGRASACMDTSDGVLTTLDQLMRLNGRGFEIDCDWTRVLADDVVELAARTETPHWMMAAGPHGEFELIFGVHAAQASGLLADLEAEGVEPIRLGTVQERPALELVASTGRRTEIDMAPLRNLLDVAAHDPERYLREFRATGRASGLE